MTKVQYFIEEHVPIINQHLTHYLQPVLSDQRHLLEQAMHYSFAGGKRLRALLALASHSLFDQGTQKILPFCCAVEIFHTYTLIHDDLPAFDNDDYRRGQPTNHKKFGEDIAILAGNALQAYAFEILAKELAGSYSAEAVIHIIGHLAYILGKKGVVGGQVLDVVATQDTKVSQATTETSAYLNKIHGLKTGALITASLILPMVLLNRSPEELGTMEKFGQELGLLFQIVDDILDVTGSKSSLGKTANKDAAQNKLTYISLFGLAKAQHMAEKLAHQAKDSLVFFKNRPDIQLPTIDLLAGFIDYILTRSH